MSPIEPALQLRAPRRDVEHDGHSEIFGRGPESLEIGMGQGLRFAHRLGAHLEGAAPGSATPTADHSGTQTSLGA